MINWTNKAVKAVYEEVTANSEKIASLEKTLKAIELRKNGDSLGALKVLNERIDTIDKSVKRVETLVQHNHRIVSTELPQVLTQSITDLVQPLVDHSTSIKSTLTTQLCHTQELVESSMSHLHQDNEKTHHKLDEIQENISEGIPDILPKLEELDTRLTKITGPPEGDWSHAVSWSEVTELARTSTKQPHKEILDEYRPLFFKDKDKQINMLKIEAPPAAEPMIMEQAGPSTSQEPLHGMTRVQTLQPNYYKLECRQISEIKEVVHGMIGWGNTQLEMHGKTPRQIAASIANGFVGILKEWWDLLPDKEAILQAGYTALTAAVIKEFIGNIDDDKMMNTAMFLRARLCDMSRVK
ncbi:hypothetical protein KI387_029817 [Taxus chinensis]|uniref:Uncharacterized protein n=1 Tax=Taxus chinensis TaxID=29808 RepID=A0AA38FDK0_TAXCH|nr:hypothetical protein KI387_029817 [Taxus chinensis]